MRESRFYPITDIERNFVVTFRVPLPSESFIRWYQAQSPHSQKQIQYDLLKETFGEETAKRLAGDDAPSSTKPNPNSVTIEKNGEVRGSPHLITFKAEPLSNGESEVIGICMGQFSRPRFDKMLAIIGNRFPESRQDLTNFLYSDLDHRRMLIILTRAYLDWDTPFVPIPTQQINSFQWESPILAADEAVTSSLDGMKGEIVDSKKHCFENGRFIYELNWHALGYIGQIELYALDLNATQVHIHLVDSKDDKLTAKRLERLESVEARIRLDMNAHETAVSQTAEVETSNLPPWEQIPERSYDRQMVRLLYEGYKIKEISQRLSERVPSKTVANRLSELRKSYPTLIPTRDKVSAFRKKHNLP